MCALRVREWLERVSSRRIIAPNREKAKKDSSKEIRNARLEKRNPGLGGSDEHNGKLEELH